MKTFRWFSAVEGRAALNISDRVLQYKSGNKGCLPPFIPILTLAIIAIAVECSAYLGVVAIVFLLFRGEGGSGSPPDARPPDRLSKDMGSVCVPVVEWPIPKSCGQHTDKYRQGYEALRRRSQMNGG